MKSKKIYKSVLSVVLSFIMVFTVISPISAFAVSMDADKFGADMYLTSKTDYTVAPGITESHITTNNSAGNNQIASYALEVDMSNPTTSVIASYKDYDGGNLGFQKVRDQAYAAENKRGVNVVAGTNADFFNMQTGETYGALVMNGKTYHAASGRPYFGITASGEAVIRTGELTSDIVEAVGGLCLLVENGEVTQDALVNDYGTYTAPRTAVGIKENGNVVLYVSDGRQAPYSVGQYFDELAYTLCALGCKTALCLDGGGSSTYVSQHEGETDLVCRNSPSDGSERTVTSALLVCSSAKPSGVFDHASLSPNNTVYTPGATVAFSAKGVDSAGYAADLPADGSYALSDDSFGSITADGVFTSNGKTGAVEVNYISGGEVCGTVTIEVQVPDELYVANTEQAVGPGVTTNFGIVAKYQNREVVMMPDDIDWTIVDQTTGDDLNGVAGTFSGLNFTANEDDAFNTIVNAELKCNTALSLELTVFIGSKQTMLYDFEYVTGEENKDEANYIPSFTLPTYSATWLTNTGNNGYPSRPDFANSLYNAGWPLYMWPNASITDPNNDSAVATVVSAEDGEPTRFGDKALKIHFDYSTYNFEKNANFYLRVTDPTYSFEGSPTAIGCWIYAPEGTTNYILYLNCGNKNGGASYQPLGNIDWVGWKYLEFDLTGTKTDENGNSLGGQAVGGSYEPYGFYQDCGVFWISYQPASMGHASEDTIYIDNISLIYGANTSDTINPTINYIGNLTNELVDGETVYTSNVNTFKAVYADVEDKYMTGIDDNATKMYIDGVDVTDKCYINEGDDEIYFYDAYLANGTHCIEIEVSDVFGNKTTDIRYFTVNGTDTNTELDIIEVNGSPVLGEKYSMAVVTNNIDDVLAVEMEVKALSNYTRYWNDFEIVAADGFELTGTPVFNETLSTINFTVKKSADAGESTDNAVVYVNVNIPTDVPEGLEATYRISKGCVTYTSEKSAEYVNGFSGKITTTCIPPFTVKIDTMVVGSTGGYLTVMDTDGNAVEGANVYCGEDLVGTTDADGKIFTDAFVSSVAEFSIYAEKDGKLSFEYSTQSFNAGGDATGAPSYVKLNAAEDPSTQQNISWMASPIASADKAIVKYATKADYEANGDATVFTEFEGESYVNTAAASGKVATNYAVRFNSAVVTGLKPATEYVYMVGDGTNWSPVKNFTTERSGVNTNFFVMGDIQSTDTSNVDAIFSQLAGSDTEYSFGIQTGDAVDNAGSYAYWEAIGNALSGDFIGETDMIHVLGNHEYTGDASGINASRYFNLPGTTDEAPLAYSFEYGNVYVAAFSYLLGSDVEEAAEWLVNDAAKSTANWKILTMHQPPYFTNVGGGSTRAMMDVITAAVDEADIDFVFAGHDHSYARTYPITAGEQSADGAVYFICAATSAEKGYQVTADPNIHAIATDEYNSVYLTVNTTDTTFDITVWNYDGTNHNVFDTYSATKDVSCSANGHVNEFDGEYLTCTVCGYTTEVGTYTGLVTNADNGKTMYLIGGNVQTGWVAIGTDNYLFDDNGCAKTGKVTYEGHTYTFAADGKMTQGSFESNGDGTYSYYINGEKQRGWFEINGYWYYFSRTIGFKTLQGEKSVEGMMYTFANSGKLIKGAWNETSQGTTYYWGPAPVTGLQEIDGETYYFNPENTYMLINDSVEIDGEIYAFDKDGHFAHYGEHIDANNDGKCDECPRENIFTRLLDMLRNFFRRIIDFFKTLFG